MINLGEVKNFDPKMFDFQTGVNMTTILGLAVQLLPVVAFFIYLYIKRKEL